MPGTAKKCYLAELHLFQAHGINFVFLPWNLNLYQIDQETYQMLSELSKSHGTNVP